jgi:hypothetical protein
MAMRKPPADNKRTRAIVKLLENINVPLPDQARAIGRTGLVATPLVGKPPASGAQRERSATTKEMTRKKIAKQDSKRWDGADQEALDILSIATSMTSGQSMDERRITIAARLREIAQGPRKWGVLR